MGENDVSTAQLASKSGHGVSAARLVEKLGMLTLTSSRNSGRAKCEKDWNWKPQPLPDYDIWHVVSGVGAITINGVQHPISAGSCFLLRPGDSIFAEQHPEHRLTVMFVHFQAAASSGTATGAGGPAATGGSTTAGGSAGVGDCLDALPRHVSIRDTPWLENLLNRLLTLDDENEDEAETAGLAAEFDAVLKAALCLIAREAAAAQGTSPNHGANRHAAVRQTIRLMKENAATPLSHEELAALTGFSPRYLNVLFKRETGQSLKTFQARARVERACMLLAESTMNVSQIAETMGYSDIYFFSKQFKKFMGESPMRYRSRMHGAESH